VIFPLVSGPFVSYNEVNCQSMRCICFVPTLPVNPPTLLLRYRIQKYICALIFCQRCTPSTVLTSVEGTIEWQVRRTLQQNLPSLVRRDKPRASQSMIGENRESGSLDGASVDRCYQSSEYHHCRFENPFVAVDNAHLSILINLSCHHPLYTAVPVARFSLVF
jgi:hypothetical protein